MSIDPFAYLQNATHQHRNDHGCGAYTFRDGPSLTRLVDEVRPKRILELGTALGYTACCLAAGHLDATIDTIERDPEHVRLAQRFVKDTSLADRIFIHEGMFEDVLEHLPGTYDLVFFDGFAPSLKLLVLLCSRISADGVLVCSNIELAGADQHKKIFEMLGDAAQWREMKPIENGQTIVLQKGEGQLS